MSNTKQALLDVAESLFAERGFYGVSIANVADELGLTKQALLHHYGTKGQLYGAVLERISRDFSNAIKRVADNDQDPSARLADFLIELFQRSLDNPTRDLLLMRELLDNHERAKQADAWYLRDFLKSLVGLLTECPKWSDASSAQAFAAVYQLVGAVAYFSVSAPTLTGIGGKLGYRQVSDAFMPQIKQTVSAVVASGPPSS
ncbi:MAG: TetR/AcrR family transcriptional regulator [Pseudomonadota bacterium]